MQKKSEIKFIKKDTEIRFNEWNLLKRICNLLKADLICNKQLV